MVPLLSVQCCRNFTPVCSIHACLFLPLPLLPPPCPTGNGPAPTSIALPDGSCVVRRVIPSDNSCLFTAVGYVMENNRGKAAGLRKVIADAVAADPGAKGGKQLQLGGDVRAACGVLGFVNVICPARMQHKDHQSAATRVRSGT